MKHILLSLFIVAGLLLVACGTPTQSPAEISPVPESPPTESQPEPIPKSFEPITLTGSGDKTSPPFTVTTREWIVDWSYNASEPQYAIFGFFIYPRGETVMYVEAMASSTAASGSTYSYAGSGDYYIQVIAANIESWEIIIRPPK